MTFHLSILCILPLSLFPLSDDVPLASTSRPTTQHGHHQRRQWRPSQETLSAARVHCCRCTNTGGHVPRVRKATKSVISLRIDSQQFPGLNDRSPTWFPCHQVYDPSPLQDARCPTNDCMKLPSKECPRSSLRTYKKYSSVTSSLQSNYLSLSCFECPSDPF